MATFVTDDDLFAMRMDRSADDLWPWLERLYGDHPGFDAFVAELRSALADAWGARSGRLKRRDLERDLQPDWFQRPGMCGYVFYVDLFAGDLRGVVDRLDYLVDLGITYVHLMPCLMPRDGDADGGYSVRDYRRVDPRLGTMDDLEAVIEACHDRGIVVCLDMVLNHTAREHDWAVRAREGQDAYADFYHTFPDRTDPDRWEATLDEVFPDTAPGNFTWCPVMERWVWTTFNAHQWDLNWSNPQVFLEMARVMLFLANRGVDVLRFDAVAFLWKRLGTRCQSEPEVHMILHALRAVGRIATPATIHLEEAIVGPAEMLTYLGQGAHAGREGNLAYHNSLMVQIWSAMATRDAGLMTHVLDTHFPVALPNATYATYLRCHDDIGWAVTDEDASAVGLGGAAHRAFLSDFYDGTFPGSFARGALFQENPATGDKRISGTTASLAGLERALAEGDADAIDQAVHRIVMGHAIIASFGGIPLIYMGDELALTNDYDYRDDPTKAHDSRWLHRPAMVWDAAVAVGSGGNGPAARVFAGIRHLIARRAATRELDGSVPCVILHPPDAALFAFKRDAPTGPLICLFNVADGWRGVSTEWLSANGVTAFHDALSDGAVAHADGHVHLPPQARIWLR
ncbi:alpha-amylase family protein [Jannaschia sp. LMIT008]|uniref:alpha-amylase family protein n=1 Tax=Jannaschia maritima TaxID=3032585 RepID=UPI002810D6C2|nr:alpha-amylase family protein [Jannaschia sp. LMIT008]